VNVRSEPYALVQAITRIIRGLSADQPVEHAKTLEDIRAEALSPNGSMSSCSAFSLGRPYSLRWWAWPACSHSQSVDGRGSLESGFRWGPSRGIC